MNEILIFVEELSVKVEQSDEKLQPLVLLAVS